MTSTAICEYCESETHRVECPIGRGLVRCNIVDALGNVRGYEWLSPQMAQDVRSDAASEASSRR